MIFKVTLADSTITNGKRVCQNNFTHKHAHSEIKIYVYFLPFLHNTKFMVQIPCHIHQTAFYDLATYNIRCYDFLS